MSTELVQAVEKLTAVVERQAQSIELLTKSIFVLLGEEMGTPQEGTEEDHHRTMDGEGLKFRGSNG